MLKTLLKVKLASLGDSMMGRMKKSGKQSKAKIVLFALLMLYAVAVVMGMSGFMFAFLGETLIQAGMTNIYFALVGLMSIGVGFIACIFTSKSFLYEAKDNELLLSMPIKPSSILGSRVLLLVVLEITYTLLIMIPATVVYCVFDRVTVMGFIMVVVGSVLLGLLTVAVASVIGWVIAWISSKMRFKNLITIVLMIAFFMGYFYVCFNLQTVFAGLVQNGAAIGEALNHAVPPLYYFGAAITGNYSAIFMLVLWTVIPFLLMYFVLSKCFLTIATSNRGERHIKYEKKEMKTSSAGMALCRKELHRVGTLPMYMLNCCLGCIFQIIIAVMLVVNKDMLLSLFDLSPEMSDYFPYLIVLGVVFCSTMNMVTAPSLSLEGNRLWILKSMPVQPMEIYKAKIKAGLIISLPALILVAVVAAFVMPMTVLQRVWVIVLPVLMQVFVTVFGMVANILMPRFEWTNETAVIKQSGSVMVGMFVPMAVIAMPAILYVTVLGSVLSLDVFFAICGVYVLALTVASWMYIKGPGVAKFKTM